MHFVLRPSWRFVQRYKIVHLQRLFDRVFRSIRHFFLHGPSHGVHRPQIFISNLRTIFGRFEKGSGYKFRAVLIQTFSLTSSAAGEILDPGESVLSNFM